MSEPARSNPSFDDWFTPGRFAALLALLIFASFPDIILARSTFCIRDFCQFGYPVAFHCQESFWRHEIPLWNPYNNCGLPFLAQWNTLVLYPGSLFYLLFPLSWSLGVFCLIHQFLAGLGMYYLGHRWTANRLAAAVAGVAFAFNGFTLNCLMWPIYMVSLAWLPWVILTVERSWTHGGRHLVLAAAAGAMQMFSGVPELILMTWGFIALNCCAALVRGELGRWVVLRRFLLVVAGTACLAAVQLLPFLDLLIHSQRESGYAATEWSMPGTGWANLLLPLFYCVKKNAGIYMQPFQGFTTSYYPGIGVLLFGLVALWRRREWRVILPGALCLMSLVLALGNDGFVYGWLRKAGVLLGFMRYPVKFVMLTGFLLPLLAAEGMRELFRPKEANPARNLRLVGIFSLVLLSLVAFLLWYARCYPLTTEPWTTVAHNGLLRAVFLILTLSVLAALFAATDRRKSIVLGTGLLVVLWMDAATHMPQQNPTVTRAVYEPGLQPIRELKPELALGQTRAMLSMPAWLKFNDIFLPDPFNMVLTYRLGLSANCNLLDKSPKADGFFSLYFKEQVEALSVLALVGSDTLTNFADFMCVGQVNTIVSHEVAGTNGQPAFTTQTFEWQPRPSRMPMLTAGQKPLFVAAGEALGALREPTLDFRKFVLLPLEAGYGLSVSNATDARILEPRVSAHRIAMTVETPAPAMVVVSQSFYHPWKAFVDEKPAKLWRANHAFQAFEVPAGRHVARLVYVDRVFQVGVAVSLATLAVCAAYWLRERKRTSHAT